jgi:hypothetical protein
MKGSRRAVKYHLWGGCYFLVVGFRISISAFVALWGIGIHVCIWGILYSRNLLGLRWGMRRRQMFLSKRD